MRASSVIDRIFTNWQVKLLSFGLAVLLYAAFQIISLDKKAFSIPLEVRSGGNYVLSENAPKFVRVEVEGLSEEIATVQESNITAYIDISRITQAGSAVISVELELEENLMLMDPLEVSVEPASVMLQLEENTIAWVPVEPLFIGTPADGYEIASWTTSDESVRISGPKSIVESTLAVYADGIDIGNKTQSFTSEVPLSTISDKVHIISSDSASIFVDIVPQIITQPFNTVVPQALLLSDEFVLNQSLPYISIELTGEKNDLMEYTPLSNIVELDFSQVTEVGVYALPVITNIPRNFTLTSINPMEVIVEVISAPPENELLDIDVSSENVSNINEMLLLSEELE